MSALEELAGLAGLVAERGESWLALVGFGVAALGALLVRQAAAGAARSTVALRQVAFAAAALAGVGVVCPRLARRDAGGG